jgi:hypothetical protein
LLLGKVLVDGTPSTTSFGYILGVLVKKPPSSRSHLSNLIQRAHVIFHPQGVSAAAFVISCMKLSAPFLVLCHTLYLATPNTFTLKTTFTPTTNWSSHSPTLRAIRSFTHPHSSSSFSDFYDHMIPRRAHDSLTRHTNVTRMGNEAMGNAVLRTHT